MRDVRFSSTDVLKAWLCSCLIAFTLTAGLYGVHLLELLQIQSRTIADANDVTKSDARKFDNGEAVRIAREGSFRFEVTFASPLLPYHVYDIYVDDQLTGLSVNNHQVDLGDQQNVWGHPLTLPISQWFTAGNNVVRAEVKNLGGPVNFQILPSRLDPIRKALFCVLGLLGVAAIAAVCYTFRLSVGWSCVCLFPLLAMLLRLLYVIATPWWIRQHDLEGHIEYIYFVAQKWIVPPYDLGWQTYQPPLYYFLSAYWLKLMGELLPLSVAHREETLQGLSLLLGNLSVIFGMGIGLLLWGSSASPARMITYSIVATLVPADIFLSARINNDVPAYTISLAMIAALVHWWRSPSTFGWIILSLLLSLALLCKYTLIIFVVPIFGVLVFQSCLTWKRKAVLAALAVLCCGMLCGGYAYQRISQRQPSLIGNIEQNPSLLFSEDTAASFLVFNPLKVLELMYNDPWDDALRRRFMWEYSFRSALYGEWRFPAAWTWLTSGFLLTGMQLFLIMLFGAYADSKQRIYPSFPIWLLFLSSIIFKVAIRASYSNGGLSDFRYTVFLVIPLAYFLAQGYEHVPSVFKPVAVYLSLLFASLSMGFQLYIFLDGA